jgi:Ca2+-binding EF-hand superfamily protein
MPAGASEITSFFPPPTSQTISLPTFLNSVAGILASLSPPQEMLSAFSAFDEDDSGQIDLAELRDALLHTSPEPGESPLTEREIDKVMSGFTTRRAFGKQMGGGMGKRGEVFKYQEFVASVAGGSNAEGKEEKGEE